jgi:phosphoribosyl-ATP pyrophosphohydrolase
MSDTITQLQAVLQQRKANPTTDSYTAQLLALGEDEIVKKIGEEAVEVILAAKGQGNERVVEETADLIYHLLVLLISRELTWADVTAELARRHEGKMAPDTD